jgi:hypothetical protein
MTGPAATCELWVNGVRVPDAGPDLYAGQPTALSGLDLAWGRDGQHEQPGPATCGFTILDADPTSDFLERLHVGSPVLVWAAGQIPGGSGRPSLYTDGSFTLKPDGLIPAPQATTTPTGPSWFYAGHTVQIPLPTYTLPRTTGAMAPRGFDLTGTGPVDAWDDLPRASVGETWRVSVSVRAPAGQQWSVFLQGRVSPVKSVAPVAVTTSGGIMRTGTGTWQTITEDHLVTAIAGGGPAWLHLGLSVENVVAAGTRWQDQTGIWTGRPGTWPDTSVYLDDIVLQPPPVTSRRVLVFTGAVTDVVASPVDATTLELRVTAADYGADLGNRVIGDDPWPVHTVLERVNRVTELAGITVPARVDTPLGALLVSARDVDAQPTYALLQDLAQTAGGVLWAATHATTGPYLWMENPENRAAVSELALQGGIIVIVGTGNTETLTTISACDLLQEPISWAQDTGDVSTVVAVTWAEQGVDDEGLPTRTDRTVTVTDTDAVAEYGTRRLSIGTDLVSELDATVRANRVLVQVRAVGWRIDGLTWDTAAVPVSVPSVDDAARAQSFLDLLDGTLRMGLPVTLVDMPAYAPRGAQSTVYVEGGKYDFTGGLWRLALTVTPSSGAGRSATWAEIDPTWTWTNWAWDMTWQDLYGVSA